MIRTLSFFILFLLYLISPFVELISKIKWVKTGIDENGILSKYNRFNGDIYIRCGFTFDDEPIFKKTGYKHDKYRDKTKNVRDNPYKYKVSKKQVEK